MTYFVVLQVLGPLFPADAVDLVLKNDIGLLADRPDFTLIRDALDAKKSDVARVLLKARLADIRADQSVDAEIAKVKGVQGGVASQAEVESSARLVLPDSPETSFLLSVVAELGKEKADAVLAGAEPRLTARKLLSLAQQHNIPDYVALFESSVKREEMENVFAKHISKLKTAFKSHKPFDQVTVDEVLAEHPEWVKEFEEEIKKHNWGEDASA